MVNVSPTTAVYVGDKMEYSFAITNTGNVTQSDIRIGHEVAALSSGSSLATLSDPAAVSLSDSPSTVTCPPVVRSLAPGSVFTCVVSYVVTQADVDRGRVGSATTVSAQPVTPAGSTVTPPRFVVETVTTTIRVVPVHPSLSLVTRATAGNKTVGDTISYTFDVTNTGDVALSDIRISETFTVASGSALTNIVCPADKQPLAPGGVLTCTADPYKVTKTDLVRGRIEKSAVAVGNPPVSPGGVVPSSVESGASSVSVPVVKSAATKLAQAGVSPFIPLGGAGLLLLLGVCLFASTASRRLGRTSLQSSTRR